MADVHFDPYIILRHLCAAPDGMERDKRISVDLYCILYMYNNTVDDSSQELPSYLENEMLCA